MSMSADGGKDFKSDINVTPLVDVVLVLLIIFMVVTPMLKAGVQVQLPKFAHGKEVQEDKNENIVLAMKEDGTMYLDNKQIRGAEFDTPDGNTALETDLRAGLAKGKPLMIKADARLKYGQVKRVLDLVQGKLGVRSVKVAADKLKPQGTAAP